MKIIWVAGARPNFMKISAIWRAMLQHNGLCSAGGETFSPVLVHTGQHYDANMSDVFFRDLELPPPDYFLGAGGGTHAEQTARILVEFERILGVEKPDVVGVVGDVDSSCACALATAKSFIHAGGRAPLLAHVEAGLRSGDRRMPEEINRIVVDALSDIFFTPEESGTACLLAEGKPRRSIHAVGNVMVDSLFHRLNTGTGQGPLGELGLLDDRGEPRTYGLVTLHRPSNVDDPAMLGRILAALGEIGEMVPVVFPVHPRTRARLEELAAGAGRTNLLQAPGRPQGLRLLPPLGYNDFLTLQQRSAFVITDSGGVQAEATALRVPCLTLRDNTEWPATVTVGSNTLVGRDPERLVQEARGVLAGARKVGQLPELWDGHAAERIVSVLASLGAGAP